MKISWRCPIKFPLLDNSSFKRLTAWVVLAAIAPGQIGWAAGGDKNGRKNQDRKAVSRSIGQDSKILPISELTPDEAILHALNRLGFGPKPGDLEHVRAISVQTWIEQQLHPETINDDALQSRLDRFPTLPMSSAQLLEQFPPPQLAARREGISVEEYRKQQSRIRDAKQTKDSSDDEVSSQLRQLTQGNPAGGAMDADANPAKGQGAGKGQGGFGNGMFNFQDNHTPQRIVAELSMAKLTRAIYSERQLNEMMVDFWYNHFNVFAAKGADRWLITAYERDAIRPNAMGKFRDLLGATAKSPAMLFFLDNWQSVDPAAWSKFQQQRQRRMRQGGIFAGGMPRFPGIDPLPNGSAPPPEAGDPQDQAKRQAKQQAKQQRNRGLNENYGRELMELHTLGVDGGYTQDDVVNVAKAFTGWTIRQPRRDAEFVFEERLHDTSVKSVLGHQIHAGGIRDGEAVLDILARDPHTARHISYELAQRFVADQPPAALVNRMSDTFLRTDGDIREVLRAMIYSPEFWTRENFQTKIKTPFELVASAARASGAQVDVPLMLVQWTNRIGEPLYQCEPPTGYSPKADAWVNPGALLNRMNFALALASGRLRGTQVDMDALLGAPNANPQATLDRAIQALLAGHVSPETLDTLKKQMTDPQILQASLDDPVKQVNTGMIAGLVLGSPEFQRR